MNTQDLMKSGIAAADGFLDGIGGSISLGMRGYNLLAPKEYKIPADVVNNTQNNLLNWGVKSVAGDKYNKYIQQSIADNPMTNELFAWAAPAGMFGKAVKTLPKLSNRGASKVDEGLARLAGGKNVRVRNPKTGKLGPAMSKDKFHAKQAGMLGLAGISIVGKELAIDEGNTQLDTFRDSPSALDMFGQYLASK